MDQAAALTSIRPSGYWGLRLEFATSRKSRPKHVLHPRFLIQFPRQKDTAGRAIPRVESGHPLRSPERQRQNLRPRRGRNVRVFCDLN
jgi:hypothetical protein